MCLWVCALNIISGLINKVINYFDLIFIIELNSNTLWYIYGVEEGSGTKLMLWWKKLLCLYVHIFIQTDS